MKNDLIRRQVAISAFADMRDGYPKCTGEMYSDFDICNVIKALPFVQPEIIRCRDCKYATNIGTPDMMCENSKAWVVATDNNFGCVFAERRIDERAD